MASRTIVLAMASSLDYKRGYLGMRHPDRVERIQILSLWSIDARPFSADRSVIYCEDHTHMRRHAEQVHLLGEQRCLPAS